MTSDNTHDPMTLASTHDLMTLPNTEDPMTLPNTEDSMTLPNTEDPMTLTNTETADSNNTVNSDKSSRALLKRIEEQVELISLLKHEVGLKTVMSSPVLRMADDDMQTKFYTGLPSYKIFALLLNKLKIVIPLYIHV